MVTDGVLHVRFVHKGFDVPLNRLGVRPAAEESRIKQALANHLIVPLEWLAEYVIQRHGDGDVTLRLDAYE